MPKDINRYSQVNVNEGWNSGGKEISLRSIKVIEGSILQYPPPPHTHTYYLSACIYIPQIHFVGEEGVDTGGLSREFWRIFIAEVVNNYCIGEPGKSLFLKNVPALQVMYILLLHNIILIQNIFRVMISKLLGK